MKLLVTRGIAPEATRKLQSLKLIQLTHHNHNTAMARTQLLSLAATGFDAVLLTITETVDVNLLDALGPTCVAISTVSVGMDHIDLLECAKRGIKVYNTPDVLTDAMAEFTVGLLIATARLFSPGIRSVTNGSWTLTDPMCIWKKE